jgi:hypothetical protein
MSTAKAAFEQGIQFAYLNHGKKLHPLHIRAYALKSLDADCFISGYLKVQGT